jgi:hypothetical protein
MALPPGGFDPLTNEQIAEKNAAKVNEELLAAGLSGDIIAEPKAVLFTIELKQSGSSILSKAEFEALLKSINLG